MWRVLVAAATVSSAALLLLHLYRSRRKRRDADGLAEKPSVTTSFTVSSDGETLGVLLRRELPREFPSRALVKRVIGRGQILVDGSPVRSEAAVLARGALVEYVLAARPRQHHALKSGLGPPSLQLAWVHVDDHLAVCVKPPGITVQGDGSANLLRRAVGWHLPPPTNRPDALTVARPMHRIDKATGGLLVFGRTNSACAALGHSFAAHGDEELAKAVQKTYLAIVVGKLEGEGVIDAPVQGKRAISRWVSLSCVRSARSGFVSTVRLHPQTGRYHQLRRHLALELACPILGDPKYLSHEARAAEMVAEPGGQSMHLWASALTLPHPATGEPLHVATEEPEHFAQTLRREESAAASMDEGAWAEVATAAEARRRRAASIAKGASLSTDGAQDRSED